MNSLEKKRELANKIEKAILPLITGDYVLYGLPYYNNIGDTLIWNGERELLKKVPYKCLGVCSWCDYPKTKLPEDVTVLITGGGYFGDLWRRGWQEVIDGIAPLRNNRIIVMPCSVFYENTEIRDNDAEFLAGFPNLKILVRDRASLEYIRKYFKNDVELVPDMAFFMNERALLRYGRRKPVKNVLYFKRNDKELVDNGLQIPERDFEIHDWAPMERVHFKEKVFVKLRNYSYYLTKISPRLSSFTFHKLYSAIYRPHMTALGLQQLSSYRKIYTTRLHAMILGVMLGREVYFIDNSYGKISSYYDTWLSDCDNIKPLNDMNIASGAISKC